MKVSVEKIAEFFGREVRTIQLWVKEEGMPREARGVYDLLEVCKWRIKKLDAYIDFLKQGGDTKLSDLQKEQIRLNNEIKTIKLAQMQGKVVDIDQVHAAWLMEVKMWTRSLEALPVQITNLIGGDRNTMAKINKLVMQIREQIASAPLDLNGEDDLEELKETQEPQPEENIE